jgi:hypothetical protein
VAELLQSIQHLRHGPACQRSKLATRHGLWQARPRRGIHTRALGATCTYFAQAVVPATGQLAALSAWSLELQRVARHAEHPWNEPLLIEALLAQGRHALRPSAPAKG